VAIIFLFTAFCLCKSATQDEASLLSADIFPPSSTECSSGSGDGETSFTWNFTAAPSGTWNAMSQPYEADVFLAEFGHQDQNSNRSWKLRVAPGGNFYSFIAGPIGEVMPPQKHDQAPWIDEVNQFVAVNGAKAHTPGQSWFIHQAGTYQKDGQECHEFYA